MVSEDVGSKLARFCFFVGAGMICTKAINFYRDYERNAATKAAESSATTADPQTPSEMVNGAAPGK